MKQLKPNQNHCCMQSMRQKYKLLFDYKILKLNSSSRVVRHKNYSKFIILPNEV